MSNNRHQEIKIRVCIFYKKIKDTLCFISSLKHPERSRMFLKIRICYITCTKIILYVFYSSSLNFFFIFFYLFNFLHLVLFFFSVIKIDQGFYEEDFHLWLNNSWGRDQESPTMWLLSFFFKKKNTYTRTHTNTLTHVPFVIHVQVRVLGDGMQHGSLPAGSCLAGFILCPQHHPAGKHTQLSIDTLNSLKFIIWMYLYHSKNVITCSLNLLNLKMPT